MAMRLGREVTAGCDSACASNFPRDLLRYKGGGLIDDLTMLLLILGIIRRKAAVSSRAAQSFKICHAAISETFVSRCRAQQA
eukprot:2646562-Amphidinium_carterae.1